MKHYFHEAANVVKKPITDKTGQSRQAHVQDWPCSTSLDVASDPPANSPHPKRTDKMTMESIIET